MDELVERARNGDHDAFATLVGLTIDRMHATAYLIVRDRTAAEDAVQDACLRAWRDLPGLREPARYEAWFRRLLVRACFDLLRHQRRRPDAVSGPNREPAVADATSTVVLHDALERAFRRLTPEHRAVVVLTHVDDLSMQDAAAALGIPVGTAKSRLHHALRALRAALDADARIPVRSAGDSA